MTVFPTELDKIKDDEYHRGLNNGMKWALEAFNTFLDLPEILESLSELEHKQWMFWTKNIAKNDDIPTWLKEHWLLCWKDYKDLSEEDKKSDRVWANKIIDFLKKKIGDIDEPIKR